MYEGSAPFDIDALADAIVWLREVRDTHDKPYCDYASAMLTDRARLLVRVSDLEAARYTAAGSADNLREAITRALGIPYRDCFGLSGKDDAELVRLLTKALH